VERLGLTDPQRTDRGTRLPPRIRDGCLGVPRTAPGDRRAIQQHHDRAECSELGGLVRTYDFASAATVVDVGGGHGRLLASILKTFPSVRGVLFDLPKVVEGAPALLAAAGVADRCEIVGGDLFGQLPPGFDTYLMSRVIHDWDDEQTVGILDRCRRVMKPEGRLLLVERVVVTGQQPDMQTMLSDLTMLVGTGGRERTDEEFRALLARAGLEITRLVPVLHGLHVIESVPTAEV